MSAPSTQAEDLIADLKRRIVEVEMRSSAAAEALAALIQAEADTIAAEWRFNEEMGASRSLRQQL